ncbi:MAG: Serine/threonine protein kinase, partial [bacterium]|nr:Serine/threonine protein kinase [bacterium]
MRRAKLAGCVFLLAAGCGAYPWRVQTQPPAWAETAWTQELGTPLHVRVDGELAFVGASNGVYALRAGGQKVWATVAAAPAKRYLTVGEGKVIVSSYSLGEKRHGFWDRTASDINLRENAHLTAYGAADGAPLWDLPFDAEGSKISPPVLAGGRVLVVAGARLLAVDATTGQVVWAQPIVAEKGLKGKWARTQAYSRVAPVVVDGKVCAAALNHLAVFDLATGALVSEDSFSVGYVDASPVAMSGRCFFPKDARGDGGGKTEVWAVNLGVAKKHLKKLWTEAGFSDKKDLGIANLALGPNALYAVTNFRVKAFDPTSGKRLWETKDQPVSPASAAHGTRTHHVGGFNFTMDMSGGSVYNDAPGTGFAVDAKRLFVPARYQDPATKQTRDVVTALDAMSGAYLGSFDAGGAIVLDLAVAPDGALLLATDQGLRTVRTEGFT